VVPVGLAGNLLAGARKVPYRAAHSKSEREVPSACVGKQFRLLRSFGIDLAAIEDPSVGRKILDSLGLPSRPPPIAPARRKLTPRNCRIVTARLTAFAEVCPLTLFRPSTGNPPCLKRMKPAQTAWVPKRLRNPSRMLKLKCLRPCRRNRTHAIIRGLSE
jgi:hypothetical protein